MRFPRVVSAFALASVAFSACAARQPRPSLTTENQSSMVVTAENFTDVLRALDETEPTATNRPQRDSAARFLAQRGLERLQDGDVPGAINTLALAMGHYTPDELRTGNLPDELGPFAAALADAVSTHGDESTALACYRVLLALRHPDAQARANFDRIRDWGERNRRDFRLPWVFHGETAEVFTEAARIVPAPDLLDHATEALLERRQAAMAARSGAPQGRRFNLDEMRQLQQGLSHTAMDLAIVHLRRADLQTAATDAARGSIDPQGGLAAALRAIASGEAGSGGLLELAGRLEQVDPPATAGVCRAGRRAYPNEARFARCLGAVAARSELYGLASAHLEAAARLAHDDADTQRSALGATVQWIEREQESDEPSAGRRALVRARELLQRWPRDEQTRPAPITAADLDLLGGRFELSFGSIDSARTQLERAVAANPPPRDAFLTLGELAWRRGDARRAVELFERGLALPLRPSESDSTFRPLFQLRLGQAVRASGDTARATQLLSEAEHNLAALVRSLHGEERARALLLQAQAQDLLGRSGEVRATLEAARTAAPDDKDVAASTVTIMLAARRWSDAHEFARASRTRLTLDRRWGVYFALWSALSARIAGLESDHGAGEYLTELSNAAGPGSAWTIRLAQRHAGALTREELLRLAHTPGQRAEALFYEALRALPGDAAASERDLRAVLETDVVRFLEFEMAWDLLGRSTPASQPPRTEAAATTTATPSR